jgi:hypothetical protein
MDANDLMRQRHFKDMDELEGDDIARRSSQASSGSGTKKTNDVTSLD